MVRGSNTNGVDTPPGTVLLSQVFTTRESSTILQPAPSDDPNEPLNWSKLRKGVNFTLALFYVLFTFVLLDIQFVAYAEYVEDVGMTTFVYTTSIALNYTGLAVGCVFFIPFTYRYGRRPVYLVSLALQLACAIWSARVTTNGELMASNLVMGLAGAISETIVQVTIADLFFTHQYATVNGLFLGTQATGAYLGPVAAGYVIDSQGWRWMWWWCTIFLSVTFLLVLFFFEETTYTPLIGSLPGNCEPEATMTGGGSNPKKDTAEEGLQPVASISVPNLYPARRPLRERFALVTKTPAPISQHFYRPFILLVMFPGMAYTAITYGSLLAWFAIMNTLAPQHLSAPPYNFSASALGLFNVAPFIGSVVGMAITPLNDWIILHLARRNNGLYEPEMRLYPAIPGALLTTGGIAMFGFGLCHNAPWPVVAVGLAINGAGFMVCGDVAISYAIDSYKDAVGDGFVGVVFVRNVFSVVVLFSLVPWIKGMGLQNMFILCVVLSLVLGTIPVFLIFWGKDARRFTADRYRHYVLH
ncbi:uncharacterized protein PV06_04415 [Exophiala oligosperma]|uniref:Major facilitator superfamily (MFS) profile domain-containing protein n=1 Tax=Exophiala oligosperma TaxID=215243 RepID=A0A0D2ATZ6_9EURO|nr:uncharacterized protein PV06_04415 [Exophiala oligosperma]KIW43301.1 hypothetical protein PV06_04415 [Exophiala oligosperma]